VIALAIVGTRVLGCPDDRYLAYAAAAAQIREHAPDVVISGGAGGSDQLAEQAAILHGYSEAAGTLVIFRPRRRRLHGEGGFRERDEKIAAACTHLVRIACQQATTWGSGWTADEADRLGKPVTWLLVCRPRRFP
jgi:hypothetical protein